MQSGDGGTAAAGFATVVSEKKKRPILACRVMSIYGPFNSRVLIDMPISLATEIFGDVGLPLGPSDLIAAVERDLSELDQRQAGLAESAMAKLALQLAFEIEHPGNSATSKSMCAKGLREAMAEIRAQAPAKSHADALDQLAHRRQARRAKAS